MKQTCSITGKEHAEQEGVFWEQLRPSLQQFFKTQNLNLENGSFISYKALNDLLRSYINQVSAEEAKAHEALAEKVQRRYESDETLQPLPKDVEKGALSFGEKLADKIADFGGSWRFIIIFVSFLVIWMLINAIFLLNKGFDPYPFILLNLILSCVAAMQAPVIMMSQNRQEDKDRQRAEYDYRVNLKAETEIRILHEKLDHLLLHQNQALVELYQLHIDLMQQMQYELEALKKDQP